MRAVWLRVRAGLRQDWRSPLVLALITGLMGALVLVSLAGARRTDTAVPRFLAWSGPTEGQVAGVPFATLGRIGRLPDVAYSERGAFMLILAAPAGHPAAGQLGQVTTWALIDHPPQSRAIIVAGRQPNPARADEVMINEAAARALGRARRLGHPAPGVPAQPGDAGAQQRGPAADCHPARRARDRDHPDAHGPGRFRGAFRRHLHRHRLALPDRRVLPPLRGIGRQHGGALLPSAPRPGWPARLPGQGEPPDRGPGPVRAGQ